MDRYVHNIHKISMHGSTYRNGVTCTHVFIYPRAMITQG